MSPLEATLSDNPVKAIPARNYLEFGLLSRNTPAFRPRVQERIQLRIIENEDAGDLFGLFQSNQDYLRRWHPWVDGIRTAENAANLITACGNNIRPTAVLPPESGSTANYAE